MPNDETKKVRMLEIVSAAYASPELGEVGDLVPETMITDPDGMVALGRFKWADEPAAPALSKPAAPAAGG